MTTPTPPPGWHPDPAGSGRLRWWDGAEWSDKFTDAPSASATPAMSATQTPGPKQKMSMGKKVAIGAGAAVAIFIVLGLIGNAVGDSPSKVASASSSAAAAQTTAATSAPKTTSAAGPSPTTASTSPAPASKPAPTSAAAAAFPESCTATPSGAFGLTGVEVSKAAGHPDGAKTIRWTTNGPIPQTGKVSFTLTSGSVMRGVSYLDGRLIANYVFHMKAAKQDNISIPPGLSGNELSVFIPAASAPELGKTWVADLEIDARSTGECKP